jgi:NAD(P)-dependent dehydrogenase (short-subunit alcohol dehydrogenase family)
MGICTTIQGWQTMNVVAAPVHNAVAHRANYVEQSPELLKKVLTRYLPRELGVLGIAVNATRPGAVETDFGGSAVRDNPELNRMIADAPAMGRVGLPDDIGTAVGSILADGSQWMTGQSIEVPGGQHI